jgi:hypothetical protein
MLVAKTAGDAVTQAAALLHIWHGTFPIHAATPSVVFAANMLLAFITSIHKYNVSIWL